MTSNRLPRIAFTVAEVAEQTGLSRRWVQMLCASGELRAFRSGRRILIRASALEEYIARREAAGVQAGDQSWES